MDRPETQQKTDSQAATPPRGDREGHSVRKQPARRSGEERRKEIAEVTLQLIASLGLQGTTVTRIAEQVGMEAPSLYAHFRNRQEMLLAALDLLFEYIRDSLLASSNPNMLRRLRDIGEAHASHMSDQFEGFVIPIFEFITAPRESGLSEVAAEGQRGVIEILAAMVDEGQRQGSIRHDLDPRLAAWQLMVCFWAEDVALLQGIDEYQQHYSRPILNLMLDAMAPWPASAEPEHCPEPAAEQAPETVKAGTE
jgi:TetR/AcrR family transcriptional regulator, cholesterol catabolism regulator